MKSPVRFASKPTRARSPRHAVFVAVMLRCGGSAVLGQGAVVLDEPFNYGDGPLVHAAAGRWLTQSGTPGQIEVSGGAVVLTQQESEDVRIALEGGPFPIAAGSVLYVACTLRFTELPSGEGSYFLHFKDGGTGFRGRVFATVQAAADGAFRLGASEASNSPTVLDQDLQLETTHVLVCRYEVATAGITLWVDPTAESDPGVTAADDGTALPIHSLALRQSLSSGNGMGAVVLDDLRVATRFTDLFGPNHAAPQILEQPGAQSVTAGDRVTFTVVARGASPLAYQWFHDEILLPDATTAELTLPSVAPSDAGSYRVLVSNAAGSVSSDTAWLEVVEASTAGLGPITWSAEGDGWLTLRWPGESAARYTVLSAASPGGPWEVLATALESPEFGELMSPETGARYYRVMMD